MIVPSTPPLRSVPSSSASSDLTPPACASGCVQSYGGGMLAMIAGTLLALTAAPLRGRMRWLGVCHRECVAMYDCLPGPCRCLLSLLFLLFMVCVLGFVFITAVKAWWNALLNA